MPRPPDPASVPAALAGPHLPVELLRRYAAGQLPPAEEHAVEAHTLDCPVCADMLEGLEQQPAAAHEASLQQLRQRLQARVAAPEAPAGPRPLPLWSWQPLAAAAVLLLTLGVSAWLVLRRLDMRSESASESVAVQPAPTRQHAPAPVAGQRTAPVAPPAPASPNLAAVAPAPGHGPRVAETAPRRQAAPRQKRVVPAEVARADEQPASAQPDSSSAALAAVVAANDTPRQPTTAGVAAAPRATTAKARRPAASSASDAAAAPAEATRTVRGRITDVAGQPLPGATVLVPGTQTGTSTSADGTFSLAVPVGTPQLAVSAIGYTTRTEPLRPADTTLALALAPDNRQLSEVTVVRREPPPMLPSVAATPAGGYPALRKYLRDSLNYPAKALEERLEGTVRLRFVVGPDGRLSDIEVLRKLSAECDAEAIRLLQEGPSWFPAVQSNRRVARKVAVDVPFKLEGR